jgi:hypothetical protein
LVGIGFLIYICANKMTQQMADTITNKFGELQTTWTSHKHPHNINFMQVVKYMHIQYPDGRNNLYWSLVNSSANDKHMIANITLDEAKAKFLDAEEKELTDTDFDKWLSERLNQHEF